MFLKVVKRHRIQGLALNAVAEHPSLVPRAIVDALEISAARHSTKGLIFAAETVRLTRLLQESGIPVACMKGASLSMLAFGDLGLRYSRDIDLLVSPANAVAADSLLRDAGYEITMPKGPHSETQKRRWMRLRKHFEYRNNRSGVQLELHWRLFDNRHFFSQDLEPTSLVQVSVASGMAIPALGRRDLLLYLCLHGANHMWSRLKWIADLGALLSQNNGEEITQLLEDGGKQGCSRSVAQSLLLSQKLFNVPAASYKIPQDSAVRRLVDDALDAMTRGGGGVELEEIPFGTSRIAIARYRLKHDWKFWIAETRNSFADEADRHHTRLPQSLSFVAPILRVPLWIARRLAHGGRSNR